MKFAWLYEMECPRPWQEDSIYNCFWQALEQVKIAEEAGFHTVWSVEHHFLDQFSVASAPEVWLSAVAQHTSKIRIGHGVRLLPFNYNNPIRAAEMAAVLDIMSKGRLEFGTGRSASAIELQGFGIDPADTRDQWDEALQMIPKIWTQEEFSWDSPTFQMPPRNVLPKPYQQPHPPLWMSGTQPDSAVMAGERGLGFMHYSMSDPVGMDKKVQSYRDAIKRAKPSDRSSTNSSPPSRPCPAARTMRTPPRSPRSRSAGTRISSKPFMPRSRVSGPTPAMPGIASVSSRRA